MDCPSEEQMIRMRLQQVPGIKTLEFDIPGRILSVVHQSDEQLILKELDSLRLDTKWVETVEAEVDEVVVDATPERKLLWWVLGINFLFFLIEMISGLLSGSMGLVADSLDMLADAFVYGMALMAVGGTLLRKQRVALFSGYLQLMLAILGFAEVLRRFMNPSMVPDFKVIVWVSVFALIANVVSLLILQRAKSNEAHIRASMIFTSNDVIVNAGVIAAGILVYLTDSRYPDLVVGLLIFLLVVRGAFRILQLARR